MLCNGNRKDGAHCGNRIRVGTNPPYCYHHKRQAPRKKGNKMSKDKSARRRINAVETAVSDIRADVARIPGETANAITNAFGRLWGQVQAADQAVEDRLRRDLDRERDERLRGEAHGRNGRRFLAGLGAVAILIATIGTVLALAIAGRNAGDISAVDDRIDGVVTSIANLRSDFERFTLDFGPRVGALKADVAGNDQEIANLRGWLSEKLGYIQGDIDRVYALIDAHLLDHPGAWEADEFRLMVLGVLNECGIPCRTCEVPSSTAPYEPPTTRGGGGSTTTTEGSTTTEVPTTTEPTTTTTPNVGPEIISISATLGETNCEGFAEVVFGANVSDPDGVRSVVFSLANGPYYLGRHTVTVTATDNLGASTSRSYRFNVPEVENPEACSGQPTIPTESSATTEGGGSQPTIP